MKSFLKLLLIYTVITAIFIIAVWLFSGENENSDREYRVQAIRAADEFAENSELDLSKYPNIISIKPVINSNYLTEENDYIIQNINGKDYIICYKNSSTENNNFLYATIGMYAVFLIFFTIVSVRIILPFERLRNLPYKLARGNIITPLQERKSKYFGKFIWGLEELRISLEKAKESEKQMQKKNQTGILELSHDIKTPLSAVRLYAESLRKGLYKADETDKIATAIVAKTSEIETFVNRITKTASDEFLNIDFTMSEFKLTEVLNVISDFYSDIFKLSGIRFSMTNIGNFTVKGDRDRTLDALTNVMNNAVKYGGGNEIKIAVTTQDGCVLIRIENDGNTLSESEIDVIFDSFHRGTNTKEREGSGLGLYIARKIMRLSGGEAYAEIKGDIFSVVLVFQSDF
jgi:signal transduction histidine kinase